MKVVNMECFLSYVLLVLGTVQCYTLDDVTRLKQTLFTNYDKGLRPIYNQSNPIEVYVRMYIQSITQFDLSSGQLDTIGYMLSSWRDERMVWSGTEFEEIQSIGLEGGDLWHPKLAQFNAMADEVQLDGIVLFQDGTVVRSLVRKFYTFCNLSMRYYPNDKHDCSYQFVSMKYSADEVRLIPEDDGINKVYLTQHGEWNIADTSAFTEDAVREDVGFQTQQLVYKCRLERQPSFNVLHRSVPLGIIAIAVLFMHMVPLDSGERLSYAVTLLLSIIFWQSIVAEDLPKNSAQISIFSIIIASFLAITGTTTIVSVILCRMASFETDRPIHACLQGLALRFRPRRTHTSKFQRQFSNLSSIVYGPNENSHGFNSDGSNSKPDGNLVKVNRSTSSHSDDFVENPHPVSWIEAANAIDRAMFYIHLVFFVLSAVAFILIFTLS